MSAPDGDLTGDGSLTGSPAELAEQLVVEVMVRDLDRSLALYTALGFTVERRDGGFAALRWGDRRLFLDQRSDLPPPHGPGRVNVRILVPDVDRLWQLTQSLGLPVERPIADRAYGLRDFTVRDPDGFGLRFASRLAIATDAPRMQRPVRYNVAASLDGYIAGPQGEYDWIPLEPAIDFGALFEKVDTVLLGRRSFELVRRDPAAATWPAGARVLVFSRTLRPADHPDVTIVADDAAEVVAGLRAERGSGEIWLYGGGALFGSLLAAGQVDRVEVTVIPILLGGGVPLQPPGAPRVPLVLQQLERWPSGQVSLHYAVSNARVP